ncbi:MAG: hypothetical protein OEV42_20510 [Deltaproteobacteria bacterium]|nr:hypothetical protein [Deltaproteobacteria bacterium]
MRWSTLSDSKGSATSGSTTYNVAFDATSSHYLITFGNGDIGVVSPYIGMFSLSDTDANDGSISLKVGIKK